jgi:hypothetical protein
MGDVGHGRWLSSFPRKRESIVILLFETQKAKWIPVFTGMTSVKECSQAPKVGTHRKILHPAKRRLRLHIGVSRRQCIGWSIR